MQRRTILSAAMAVAFSAGALAQDGDLSRVTMRVLDSLDDADAVVLELDANRAESERSAESDGRGEAGDDRGGASDDAGGRDSARAAADDDARSDLRRERNELHEDDDERGEGRREDRDIERPATPPAPTP
jgi:hypothetical protein